MNSLFQSQLKMMPEGPAAEFWNDRRMPYVETRRACQSRVCYKAHSHPTFSIGAVDSGQSVFSSFFAQPRRIEAGALVVIPAHVEHACNPLPNGEWSYQMMHFDASWIAQLFSELSGDLSAFQSEFAPCIAPQVIQNIDLYHSFSALNRVLFDPEIPIGLKEQAVVEVLTEIFLPEFEFKLLKKSAYFNRHIARLGRCLNDSARLWSLQDLSQEFGISRYAIIRLCKNNFGLTPHAYQINQKVNQARQMLKHGVSVLQAAHDLGFADQSHFHHVFKMHAGISPKQYQQQCFLRG